MEITALAQQAVSIVAAHLSAVAAGVGDAVEAGAVRTVYGLLCERFGRTALGKTVLDQLRQQPQDPDRQQVAAAMVAEHAQADPEFAELLRRSVGSVVHQGNAGQVVRHSPVNVTAARDMRLHRSFVSAGDIDNSRKTVRIGTGGWILAAVLLVGGATTTGVVIGNSDDPPDPMSIGTDVGEAGVRQTAEAVRDALADGDTALLCALSAEETRDNVLPGTEVNAPSECPDILAGGLEALPSTYRLESSTLSVGEIAMNVHDAFSDNGANVLMVNRDAGAECQQWKLHFVRENGRWQLLLDYFAASYVVREPGDQFPPRGCFPDDEG